LVFQTGHGDDSKPLPDNRSLDSDLKVSTSFNADAAKKAAEEERKRLLQQAQQNQDAATKLRRENERQQAEAQANQQRLSIESAASQFQGTSFSGIFDRQLEQFNTADKYNADITQTTQDLEDLRIELERLGERKDEPGISAVIDQYKATITASEDRIKALQAERDQKLKNMATEQQSAQQQAAQDQALQLSAERRARAVESARNQLQAQINAIKDPNVRAIAEPRLNMLDTSAQYDSQIAAATAERDKQQAALNAIKSTPGIDLNSPEIALATNQIAALNEQIDHLKENESIELNIGINQQDDAAKAYQLNQRTSIMEGLANIYDKRGGTYEANQIRRETATQQENTRYQTESASIAASGLPTEQIQQMQNDAEALNQVNLENIKNQFQSLGDTVEGTLQNGLGTFFNDILSGKDAVDSLGDAIKGLLSQFAQLATQRLMFEIFGGGKAKGGGGGGGLLGSLLGGLGGGGGGASAGGGGVLSTLFNSASSLFHLADGGAVGAGDFSALRNDPGAIGEALRREGPNAVLLAATPGEEMLNTVEASMYRSMFPKGLKDAVSGLKAGIQKPVLNFKTGGTVPGGLTLSSAMAGGGGRGGNSIGIDIPISLSGDGGGLDAIRLKRSLKSAVIEVINNESRPNGALNKKRN
jgi:hypothetical protein